MTTLIATLEGFIAALVLVAILLPTLLLYAAATQVSFPAAVAAEPTQRPHIERPAIDPPRFFVP